MNIDTLPKYSDERGSLVPVDISSLPFVPKRFFYVTNVPSGFIRGEHGHFKCKQYYICLAGRIEVTVYDGFKEEKFMLISGESIFIDKGVWSSEKFTDRSDVLLVMCSEKYDQKDYFTQKWISGIWKTKFIDTLCRIIKSR